MKELLWKYLIGPVVADSRNAGEAVWQGVTAYPGYNPVNTIVYALTAVILLYLAYRFFKGKEVELDEQLALYSIPFMFLGGALRFIEDAQIISSPQNIVLITPLIYILIALIYIPTVTLLNRRKFFYLGASLLLPFLAISTLAFSGINLIYLISVISLTGVLTSVYYWLLEDEYSTNSLVALAASQFFEGVSSMTASLYNYSPKQLLAQQFNSLLGPPGILLMKIIVLFLAIRVIMDMEGEKMKGLTLLVLYAIGFGTGFRVFLRVLAGI